MSNVVPSYRFSRLAFRADIIERLPLAGRFRVITPFGTFEMTKAEFVTEFSNVRRSSSYADRGIYHYPRPPKRAFRFLREG